MAVKHESSSRIRIIINYESKKCAIDSKASGSFSVKIRALERTIVRSPSGSETLLKQINIGDKEDASVTIVFEIPRAYLGEEETCNRFVADVFSKAEINIGRMQEDLIPHISEDAIIMSRQEEGFIVEAEAEIVVETLINDSVCDDDDDLEGRRRAPIEQDCAICLEELSSSSGEKKKKKKKKKKIMKLPCSHNFHKDCVLSWLSRKHSCPSCRDDINNPRPKKKTQKRMMFL